jgi:hypothetical protein
LENKNSLNQFVNSFRFSRRLGRYAALLSPPLKCLEFELMLSAASPFVYPRAPQ